MKRLLTYFLHGLLFTVPITVTFYVLYRVFFFLDNIIPLNIRGLGIVVVVSVITIIGFISNLFLANPILTSMERVIERTPLVKFIYSSVKDLIAAFVGEKKRFNHPVLVRTNDNPRIERIGFITQEDLSAFGLQKDRVAVYFPFSYGMNGMLMIVSTDSITAINVSGTEMMKFIISGGVTDIHEIKEGE